MNEPAGRPIPRSPGARALGVGVFVCAAALAGCSGGETKAAPVDAGAAASDAAAAWIDAGSGPKIYVTAYGDDVVTGIDEATLVVLGNIPVGKGPAILLATPDGSRLYSADWGDNTISAIDVASHAVTTITVDSRPWVETMSHDGRTLYAGLNSDEIAVIDVATNTMTTTFATTQLPASLIVSPDGATLYMAFLDDTVQAISATTGAMVHPALGVGNSPAWITISPDGSKVFTFNILSGDVTVVDTASWTVTATVTIGSGTYPIIGNPSPDGGLVAVTNFGNETVSVIDTATNAVTRTVMTGGRPVGIGFSADGTRAYATDFGPTSLAVSPITLALSLSTAAGFSGAIKGPGELTAFDPATGMVIGKPVPLGKGPTSVVVGPR